jgi:hypothetical protein
MYTSHACPAAYLKVCGQACEKLYHLPLIYVSLIRIFSCELSDNFFAHFSIVN